MAPRERRVDTSGFALLPPPAAARLTTPRTEGPARRGEGAPPRVMPEVEGAAALDRVSPESQAETLRAAARDGVPFCEECGQ